MAKPETGRDWHPRSALLFVALALVVLGTFDRYGLTADESTWHIYGTDLVDFYASGGADRTFMEKWNWHLYGGLFDAPAAWLSLRSPLGPHATRSLLTALTGLAGIAGCWYAALAVAGPRAAFLAAGILALIPGYWGQMFGDSRDIPFAAAFMWALAGMVRLARPRMASGFRVAERLRERGLRPQPWSPRRPPRQPSVPVRLRTMGQADLAACTGVAIGAALGIRVGGVILVPILVAVLAAHFTFAPRRTRAWPYVGAFLIAGSVAYAVMLAAWPYALLDPLAGPIRALLSFERFDFPFPVLFGGRMVSPMELPRSYLPVLLLLTLPEAVLLLLAIGTALAVGRLLRCRTRPDAVALLPAATLVLAAVFPIAYVVARRTPLYNGIRHMLFVLPPLACLGAVALDAVLTTLVRRGKAALRAAAAALVLAAGWQAWTMARLWPYEYIYFNSLAGGVRGAAGRYELEYWGSSISEATIRLGDALAAAGKPLPRPVFVCRNPHSAAYYFGDRLRLVGKADRAEYWIGTADSWCPPPARSRPVVTVERMGIPLAFAVELSHP